MGKHLVFYDGACGLCDHIVQLIIRYDHRKLFDFAPLQGTTAKILLKDLPAALKTADSLVLVENYLESTRQYFLFGQGAFRICWLLGGCWAIPGAISWLPSSLYNWGYRLVARNRHRLFRADTCILPTSATRHRFLP
ncbi:MAG: DUF393 domain-containing protein [Parachlamydiaceae bacterium]